jgi:hypothetical protein
MSNNLPPFHQVVSEETSFKRIIGPTGQEALEVEIESIVKSLAGVTETRSQSFALAGDQAAKLVAAVQTITENMLNLVEKSSQEALRRYEEAQVTTEQEDTAEDTAEEAAETVAEEELVTEE